MSLVQKLEGLRILVVEDEPDSLEAIRHLLELHGASVRTETSVPDALVALGEFCPDVLLSDLAMPGQDGFDLVRQVRIRPGSTGGHTPAVALTAYASPDYRQRALDAGFQRFLSKPVDAQQLVDTLLALGRRRGLPPTRPAVASYAHVEKVPDLSGVRVLVVDDEADARDLVLRVLSRCGAEVVTADSAREALAVFERDAPDVLVADVGMPDEDGYMLLRRIRALPAEKGGQVPAICLTAYSSIEDRIQALQAGFQIHMPKPVNFPQLASTIASLVGPRAHA
jgi:CheY-like chemotaxis protein